jgi:diketogulonate reductase-like aldo/keto reductase
MTDMKHYKLNDGHFIPAIGLGTIGMKGEKGVNELTTAIKAGYRYIDSSTNYNNEGVVGEAIRRSSVPRDELFIASKLPGAAHDYDEAFNRIHESLYRMGIDYFDQYLIHWPLPMQGKYVEAWKALIDAQKLGLIKSIGVSNFLPEHLDKIIEETGVTPAMNQVERHPYFNNKDLVQDNIERGIIVESWSTVGRNLNDLRENEEIAKIADKYGKDNTQVIIRWNLQNGVLPIVKSSNPNHQRGNLDVFDFELTDEELQTLDSLDKGEAGLVEGQDPNEYEEYD